MDPSRKLRYGPYRMSWNLLWRIPQIKLGRVWYSKEIETRIGKTAKCCYTNSTQRPDVSWLIKPKVMATFSCPQMCFINGKRCPQTCFINGNDGRLCTICDCDAPRQGNGKMPFPSVLHLSHWHAQAPIIQLMRIDFAHTWWRIPRTPSWSSWHQDDTRTFIRIIHELRGQKGGLEIRFGKV